MAPHPLTSLLLANGGFWLETASCPHSVFLKIIFIDYAITVVPIFPSLSPLPSNHHSLRQSIPTLLFMSMGHTFKFFWLLRFLYCTLIPHGYSVTTYLYFLIPLPLHPFSPPLPSGNHQNALHTHDSVSVLVCLVCFSDSIVGKYVFISILLFTVLIFLS